MICLWTLRYTSEVHNMPLMPMICLWSLQTHFEHFETSLHLVGLTQLPHLPHACTPQWVPIVWHVPTGPLYVSASCSTVYKSSPLARESLEFSLWISFARLVVLCTLCCFTYKKLWISFASIVHHMECEIALTVENSHLFFRTEAYEFPSWNPRLRTFLWEIFVVFKQLWTTWYPSFPPFLALSYGHHGYIQFWLNCTNRA